MVLSIAAMSAGSERYYLDLAREDYYLEGGEPRGLWAGSGAAALDLKGKVKKGELLSLFEGRHPDTGEPLVQLQRGHQPGWDLTFSAPKSVSILWALLDEETRSTIQRIQDSAVRAALRYLEEEAAFTRRGPGGQTIEPVNLVVAGFEHGSSRAQDPALHTHALVLNVAVRGDNSTGTLRSRDLYQHKMAAGAAYRAELARGLRAELGVKLRAEGTWFEIVGIPEKVTQAFSKRREAIIAAMSEAGAAGAKAAEFFTKSTRSVKEHVARADLVQGWQSEGENLGILEKDLRALLGRARPLTPKQEGKLVSAAFDQAAQELAEKNGHFRERDLLRASLERLQHRGVSLESLRALTRERVRGLQALPADEQGYQRFTTKASYALEERLLALADATKGSTRHLVSGDHLSTVLKRHPSMTAERREALRYLVASDGAVKCLQGMAGTGKTSLLHAARQAWQAQGLEVIGTAVAARTAAQLGRDVNIKSSSLAGLLRRLDPPGTTHVLKHHGKQLARVARDNWRRERFRNPKGWRKAKTSKLEPYRLTEKSVVVLDEASMVGTRDMEKLLHHVVTSKAKLVLVGDVHQLQAVESGGSFASLSKRLGRVELRTIARQREEWMRDAVQILSEGDTRGALALFALNRRLEVAPTRADAERRLIEHWEGTRTTDLSETIILGSTNVETERLNRLAQQARATDKKLGLRVARIGTTSLHEGDRVVFTENDKVFGVLNGDLGTVERLSVGKRGYVNAVTVRLDRQEEKGARPFVRVTFTPTNAPKLSLGYALTSHKAQGATFERAFVLAGGMMQDREMAYVQASRTRGETFFFVSEQDAGEDLAELARSMERSRKKELAHELRRSPTLTQTQER